MRDSFIIFSCTIDYWHETDNKEKLYICEHRYEAKFPYQLWNRIATDNSINSSKHVRLPCYRPLPKVLLYFGSIDNTAKGHLLEFLIVYVPTNMALAAVGNGLYLKNKS